MTDIRWRGVFPALTSKFTADDRLDFGAMERHLAFQLDAGVHGLIVLGWFGEGVQAGADERLWLAVLTLPVPVLYLWRTRRGAG